MAEDKTPPSDNSKGMTAQDFLNKSKAAAPAPLPPVREPPTPVPTKPDVAFSIVNKGQQDISVFSVAHDATGILTDKHTRTLKSGESLDFGAHYDLLRVKLAK